MSTQDDDTDIKPKVIEALQECVYDLESEGQLIDADAIRTSLASVKELDEQSVDDAVQNLSKEGDNEVADSRGSVIPDTADTDDSSGIDDYFTTLAAGISSTVEGLLKLGRGNNRRS